MYIAITSRSNSSLVIFQAPLTQTPAMYLCLRKHVSLQNTPWQSSQKLALDTYTLFCLLLQFVTPRQHLKITETDPPMHILLSPPLKLELELEVCIPATLEPSMIAKFLHHKSDMPIAISTTCTISILNVQVSLRHFIPTQLRGYPVSW